MKLVIVGNTLASLNIDFVSLNCIKDLFKLFIRFTRPEITLFHVHQLDFQSSNYIIEKSVFVGDKDDRPTKYFVFSRQMLDHFVDSIPR